MVDLVNVRKQDWNYGQNQEKNWTPLQHTRLQVTTKSGYTYTLKHAVGASDPRVKGVKKAVETVTAAGFALPPLEFRVSDVNSNVAIKGDAQGNFSVVVYIGGAAIHHDKKVITQKESGVVGGQGMNRGVAHQIYDGTQRWFGNPKQHAMAVVVVIHELGHVMHESNDAQSHWKSMMPDYMTDTWKAPSKEVSQYAGKSGGELVAEVFAGTLSGKKYSANVVNAYRALGGAEAPNFFA